MKTFEDIANPWIDGLPTYEPGRPIEEVARELGFNSADEVSKLASNENALGPSRHAAAAMRRAAGSMHRYPDGGAYYLRRALARKLRVRPEQILAANGSNELIVLLAHVFLGPRSAVVASDKAFVMYKLIALSYRARVIETPMRNFTHDLDAMLRAITPQTRLVFVANPNNPTGTMVGQKAIDSFMRGVPDHVVVCFDEAYIELLPPTRQPDVLKYVRQGRNAVVLRTFSKTYGLAGLRIGYAVASAPCIDLLNKARQPFNVNAMALAAAVAALGDEAYVRRTRRMVADGLAYLERELGRMGIPFVSSVANFMLARVAGKAGSAFKTGREAFEAMMREGVIVRPVDCYGLPEYVRITVGTQAENRKCIRALKRAWRLAAAAQCPG